MWTYLFWLLAGVIVAGACVLTARTLWAERNHLPSLAEATDSRARLDAGREVAQHYFRLAASVGVGVFCVLVALGALVGLVTGGS